MEENFYSADIFLPYQGRCREATEGFSSQNRTFKWEVPRSGREVFTPKANSLK
jgi:hypothetical protein